MSLTFQNFAGEVQSWKIGIAGFEQFTNPQRLFVVVKATLALQTIVKDFLARVAKRRMAQIVGQRERFHEVFVQPQRTGHGAGDRSHLERVRQPRPVVVAHLAREDLCLPA